MAKTTRRILVLVPLHITAEEKQSIKRLLASQAWEGTEIFVEELETICAVNSVSEAEIAEYEFTRKLKNLPRRKFDAVLSYCYADVGVETCRKMLEILVVGPLESSVMIANMLANRFATVGVGPGDPPYQHFILPFLRRRGLAKNLVATRSIGFNQFFVFSESGPKKRIMVEALLKQARAAVKCDGAEALILSCTGFPLSKELMSELRVPVVDAIVCLKVAEALIDLEITSKQFSSVRKPASTRILQQSESGKPWRPA